MRIRSVFDVPSVKGLDEPTINSAPEAPSDSVVGLTRPCENTLISVVVPPSTISPSLVTVPVTSIPVDVVVNLAAQAGVRYSIENPESYIDSNLVGFANILEGCRHSGVNHLVYASSSSVYGANKKFPFQEIDKTDHQVSFYAATKKSTESLAHSYSSLWGLPITMLRFFTVYGPYGRPDMAYFSFTKKILEGKIIEIFNKGKMYRDYTYVDDIVDGIYKLLNKAPVLKSKKKFKNDSLSPVAPFRILNIGNTKKVYLLDFINTLEKELNKKIKRKYLPMQKGDVPSTLSDSSLLKRITGYNPKTNYKVGIKKFINWYTNYYR